MPRPEHSMFSMVPVTDARPPNAAPCAATSRVGEEPSSVSVAPCPASKACMGGSSPSSCVNVTETTLVPAALQKLARERDIGILLIHHLRKSGGDPFERMTGSAGFQGASDTLIVLDKGRGGTRLLARGRDIEEVESELAFDNLAKRWRLAQPRPATSAHPERDRIKVLLAESSSPLSAKEVEDATGQGADAVRQLLKSMVDKGEIVRVARGRYSPCTETSACPGAGDHNNHNNHNGHNDHEKRLATEREIAEREEFERQAMNAPDPEVTSNAAETMRFLHDAFEQTLSRMSAVRRSGGAAS